jgi:MoxR-like ATPase
MNNEITDILTEVRKEIIGQEKAIRSMATCLFTGGHALLEGFPGLAKTKMAKTFSKTMGLSFGRIQFTPDLLPSDVTGGLIYQPQKSKFEVRKGPIFCSILLADEINRAPAKVQSALLQSMEERSVTIGDETLDLPSHFMVLATQNPIEQEGTYSLPEAQMDRFLLKISVQYPSLKDEIGIFEKHSSILSQNEEIKEIIKEKSIKEISKAIDAIYIDPKLIEYIVKLIRNTRPETEIKEIQSYIRYGASPRASIALGKVARANAWMEGRNFVIPEDILHSWEEVVGHRTQLQWEASSEGLKIHDILQIIQKKTPLP